VAFADPDNRHHNSKRRGGKFSAPPLLSVRVADVARAILDTPQNTSIYSTPLSARTSFVNIE
jgi:hypothetical protein